MSNSRWNHITREFAWVPADFQVVTVGVLSDLTDALGDLTYGVRVRAHARNMTLGRLRVDGLVISSITNPAGTTFRYNFSGSPDLSTVVVGDFIHVSGCDDTDNNGRRAVTGVSDGSDYIEVTNADGATQGGAAGIAAVSHTPLTENTLTAPAADEYFPDYVFGSGRAIMDASEDTEVLVAQYEHGGAIRTIEELDSGLGHGLTNCKATLSGTTFAIAPMDSARPFTVAIPLANGTLQWLSISTTLSMTLPSATFAERILQFTNADGSATLTLSGDAVGVVFFAYVIYDSGTPYLAISRSPHHTKTPANYYHTPTSTALTRVGAAAPGVWDAMIISKAGTLTDTDSPAICLGPLCYGTISGTNGRFSSMALCVGEFPKWNNRQNPYKYDGTNVFDHRVRTDTQSGASGAGSTDTTVAKNTNNTVNVGYAIQVLLAGGSVASGGVGGTEYVITEDGQYEFSGNWNNDSSAEGFGITVNSTQRTTGVTAVTLANQVAVGAGTAANSLGNVTVVYRFSAGDVVRFQNGAGAYGARTHVHTARKVGW